MRTSSPPPLLDALSCGQRTRGWRRWPQSWELATTDSAGQHAHGSVQMGMAVRLFLSSGRERPSSGGMTADGSVVAMTFFGTDGQSAYFHNANGWFHLASALGANGVD